VTNREILALTAVVLPALISCAVVVVPRRLVDPLALVGFTLSSLAALTLGAVALAQPDAPRVTDWVVIDTASGLLVAVIGLVALASTLASPSYLRTSRSGLVRPARAARAYYAAFGAFLAVLVAVPLSGNLATAWLLIEATTAASAVLVGFSGKPRALEAGWKYLLLTSLGLGFALLGIVLIGAVTPGGRSTYSRGGRSRRSCGRRLSSPLRSRGARGEGLAGPVQLAAGRVPEASPRLIQRPGFSCRAARWGGGARARAAIGAGTGRAVTAWFGSRSPSRCRSSGDRSPGSGCSRTSLEHMGVIALHRLATSPAPRGGRHPRRRSRGRKVSAPGLDAPARARARAAGHAVTVSGTQPAPGHDGDRSAPGWPSSVAALVSGCRSFGVSRRSLLGRRRNAPARLRLSVSHSCRHRQQGLKRQPHLVSYIVVDATRRSAGLPSRVAGIRGSSAPWGMMRSWSAS
jgi:hypothetical protein